jgi:Uma2 family endonuclease
MKRLGDPARDVDAHFTYRHYRTWPDEERWELIDGVAWAMSPAPIRYHQRIAGRFFTKLDVFLEGKDCRAYIAPFDVLLPRGDEPDDDVDCVVQPDVVVYCDRSKLTRAGARGAPDLALEVLSPSTSKKDQREKFGLYERTGVREYWVADPAGKWLCVYRRDAQGGFDGGELRDPDREYGPIESSVLEGFVIDPKKLFEED